MHSADAENRVGEPAARFDLMNTINSEWLTAQEAASYLRIKPRTLLQWARQGTMKGFILSGTDRITWRFRQVDLDATMKSPSVAHTNGGTQCADRDQ